MSEALDLDTPGCACDDNCKTPCWMRVGTAPACENCGCPPFGTDVPNSGRTDLLEDARRIVRGDRQADYGSPERNLTRIGIVWGVVLGFDNPIPPRQVALMLASMKIVRAAGRDNRDDLLDLVGYATLADEAAS